MFTMDENKKGILEVTVSNLGKLGAPGKLVGR